MPPLASMPVVKPPSIESSSDKITAGRSSRRVDLRPKSLTPPAEMPKRYLAVAYS